MFNFKKSINILQMYNMYFQAERLDFCCCVKNKPPPSNKNSCYCLGWEEGILYTINKKYYTKFLLSDFIRPIVVSYNNLSKVVICFS